MKRRSKWVKKCSECGKVIRSHNKSLLCNFHYHELYRNRPEIRARKKEYNKKYHQRPEVKLMRKKIGIIYYLNNKDKFKEKYQKNRDKIKEYYQENKVKIRKIQKEYRQKKRFQKQQEKHIVD